MIQRTWIKRKPKQKKPAGPRRKLEDMDHWSLIRILDAEYSYNLRAGTAAAQGHPFVKCYTCDHIGHWKDMDCGHFHQRELMGLRYDSRNTRIQCQQCNRYMEGRKATFASRLMADGVDMDSMQRLADWWGKAHHPNADLVRWIKEYRALNAKIRKQIQGME